jgi:hypothetical protein
MLYTIAVILLVLWLLGLVSGYTIGAFIHVLLVVAIVLFLVGALNIAITQPIARMNLSQNMSFRGPGKARCAFGGFCEILEIEAVFAEGS